MVLSGFAKKRPVEYAEKPGVGFRVRAVLGRAER